jgi:DNA polymerase III epsilon subunit family exonuclease
MPIADRLLRDTEFVALDLETTGLSPVACRIVEFGAVRFRASGEETASFSQLVDPECSIPRDAMRIHGISDRMVRGMPRVRDVLPRFLDFLGGSETVLLAHNALFDLGFLGAAIAKANVQAPANAVIDTLSLSRACLRSLPSHRLENVARHLGIADSEEHRGLSDARLAMHVLLRIVARSPGIESLADLFRVSPPLGFAEGLASALGPPPGYEALAAAIEQQRPIVMLYDGGTRGLVRRRVTPRGLFQSGGRPYLAAFCHLDQMDKTFRVDRIREFAVEEAR